jgi:hypothetical protein
MASFAGRDHPGNGMAGHRSGRVQGGLATAPRALMRLDPWRGRNLSVRLRTRQSIEVPQPSREWLRLMDRKSVRSTSKIGDTDEFRCLRNVFLTRYRSRLTEVNTANQSEQEDG